MRDHTLKTMEPILFQKWYECNIALYTVKTSLEDDCSEIKVFRANKFSREIQSNYCQQMALTDDKEFAEKNDQRRWSGKAWHFPVKGWSVDERFVVRMPTHD